MWLRRPVCVWPGRKLPKTCFVVSWLILFHSYFNNFLFLNGLYSGNSIVVIVVLQSFYEDVKKLLASGGQSDPILIFLSIMFVADQTAAMPRLICGFAGHSTFYKYCHVSVLFCCHGVQMALNSYLDLNQSFENLWIQHHHYLQNYLVTQVYLKPAHRNRKNTAKMFWIWTLIAQVLPVYLIYCIYWDSI